MLENIIEKGKSAIVGLTLAGMIGCSSISNYQPEILPKKELTNYSNYMQIKQPKKINSESSDDNRYVPKSEQEISDVQQTAGWCLGAILASTSMTLGVLGYVIGKPQLKSRSLTLGALGGLGMIPTVPMCIYGVVITQKYRDRR